MSLYKLPVRHGHDNAEACFRYDVSKKQPQGTTLGAALNQVFDPELTSWLLAEMAENRDKRVGPKKVRSRVYTASLTWGSSGLLRCAHVAPPKLL